MQRQKKEPCSNCHSKSSCNESRSDTCEGESLRCFLKKGHVIAVIAIAFFSSFGAKLSGYIFDTFLTSNKDAETLPVIPKGYKVIEAPQPFSEGREVIFVEKEESPAPNITLEEKEEGKKPQNHSLKGKEEETKHPSKTHKIESRPPHATIISKKPAPMPQKKSGRIKE